MTRQHQDRRVVAARHGQESATSAAALWSDLKPEFRFDGSLRDIYVLDTSMEDWARAAAAIEQSGYPLSFEGAWSGSRFPFNLADLFARSPDSTTTRLSVDIGDVQLACHFFTESSIEFDLDPRQVTGEVELQAILSFMGQLSRACGKPVLLTPENSPQLPILTVLPPSSP